LRVTPPTAKKKPKALLPWAESTVEEVEETIAASRAGLEADLREPLETSVGAFLLQCNIDPRSEPHGMHD
jgi:hypothetical protein